MQKLMSVIALFVPFCVEFEMCCMCVLLPKA